MGSEMDQWGKMFAAMPKVLDLSLEPTQWKERTNS